MKILCVGHRVPYPVRDGGNVRVYGYLRELGRRHEVSYLCRADEPRPDAEHHLRGLARTAEIVVDPFRPTWGGRLRSVVSGSPFGLVTRADAFFRRFRDRLREEPFDLVYLFGIDVALLAVEALATTPVVYDLCDSTFRYFERQVRAVGNPARTLWYGLQASRYRALERRLLARDFAVLVASPSEAEALGGGGGPWRSRVHVAPTGVAAAPPAEPASGPPRLVFTGALGYAPNADAVLHFCREILPRVQRERPDARFEVLGGGASPALLAACRAVPNVEFLGFVPDLFGTLRRKTLFVCPMRQGTGIKTKLLEAMACGLPIVASPIAVEGVPEARDGLHLRLAASAADFAQRILELLRDDVERKALGDRAREVAGEYGWDRLGERVDRICREEVTRRARVH